RLLPDHRRRGHARGRRQGGRGTRAERPAVPAAALGPPRPGRAARRPRRRRRVLSPQAAVAVGLPSVPVGVRRVRDAGSPGLVLVLAGRSGMRRRRGARRRARLVDRSAVARRPRARRSGCGRRRVVPGRRPAREPRDPVRLHRVPPRTPPAVAAAARARPRRRPPPRDRLAFDMTFLNDLDRDQLPHHVGIVMDGNGRWAKARGLPRTDGHNAGEEALFDVIEGGVEVGRPCLTVFAFSTENWKRPPSEVRYLMNFKRDTLRRRTDEMHAWGVKVQFIGRRDWRLPRGVLREMERAETLTRDNTRMKLTIAINYGGRAEIVDAVRRILREHDQGRLNGERITPESIASRLYDPGIADVDL